MNILVCPVTEEECHVLTNRVNQYGGQEVDEERCEMWLKTSGDFDNDYPDCGLLIEKTLGGEGIE